jgi:hypothetical protein
VLPLNDPRWKDYDGGYGTPYDASIPLAQLLTAGASKSLWEELWNELHHQGDLGAASYAAVPHLLEFARTQAKLDWNVFALIALIELERPHNLPVPAELSDGYYQTIESIPRILAEHSDTQWDDLVTQGASSCIALARGQREFARVYLELSLRQGLEWLKEETGYEPDTPA